MGWRHRLSVIRVNGVSDTDMSIGKDVGAKSTTVDQLAQDALRREALQVSAWLAQPLSKTLDISNSESPTDEAVEIDAPRDEIAPSLAIVEPTASRQHELIKNLGLDKRQIVATAATSHRCKGARPNFISITHEASAGGCLRLGNEHYRSRSPSGQGNRLHAATLRRISRGSG